MDYTLSVDRCDPGATSRARAACLQPAGKGINVSLMLARLGIGNMPLGVCAGVTGGYLLEHLTANGLDADFVHVNPTGGPDVWTRINVKLSTTGEKEREINVAGPTLAQKDFETLLDKLEARLAPGDTLVLAGSVPPGVGDDAYAHILNRLSGRDIRVVADTTGERLRAILGFHPFLIKPNRQELEELTGVSLPDDRSLVQAARALQKQGAGHVLISLGGDGCLFVPSHDPRHARAQGECSLQGACLRMDAMPGRVVSTVGAGDSMVAGFLCGLARGWNADHVLHMATACAAATAFSNGLGTRPDIDKLYALCAIRPCLHLPY